jgi:hypothetical protein
MRLDRSWLTRFGFCAFFQRGFARKLYPAFIVDADALDPNHVTGFHNVLRAFDAEMCTSPSLPGKTSTNAPNSFVETTRP